jgi:hypothetical protein
MFTALFEPICPSRARGLHPARGRERGFIEEVRGDEPDVAAKRRIEERELETGGLN